MIGSKSMYSLAICGLFLSMLPVVTPAHTCDTTITGNFIEDCPMDEFSISDGGTVNLDFRRIVQDFAGITLTAAGYALKNTTNAKLPGPVLRIDKGATFTMRLSNSLVGKPYPEDFVVPANAKPANYSYSVNIHTHGLHVSALEDDPKVVIPPGETRDYTFNIPHNHAGGTHWYHSHVSRLAEMHIGAGALGMMIINDDPDGYEIPVEILDAPEKLLVFNELVLDRVAAIADGGDFGKEYVYDRDFKVEGTLPSKQDRQQDGINYYLVNGLPQPRVQLKTNQVTRLRMLHVTPSYPLILTLDTAGQENCEMILIAKDGVYLRKQRPTGITSSHIRLSTSARADVMITCTAAGTYSLRRSHPPNLGLRASGISLQFVVEDDLSITDAPYKVLFDPCLPPYLDDTFNTSLTAEEIPTHSTNRVIGVGPSFVNPAPGSSGGSSTFLGWDTNPSPNIVFPANRKGTIQEFTVLIRNHPLHIHINHMQVVKISNDELWDQPGDWVDALRSIPYLDPSGSAPVVRMRLDRFGNDMVFHCHNVAHSDIGSLGYFELEWDDDVGPTPDFRDTCDTIVSLKTPAPTLSPTTSPTISPTRSPSTSPTKAPLEPTPMPTSSPIIPESPTGAPTTYPTLSPTNSPSFSPTNFPSQSPVTFAPTISPTAYLPQVKVFVQSSTPGVNRVKWSGAVLGSQVTPGFAAGKTVLHWNQSDPVDGIELPDSVYLSPRTAQSGKLALDPTVLRNPGNGAVGPYTFSLFATLSDASGHVGTSVSKITIEANSPPTGGSLFIDTDFSSGQTQIRVFAFSALLQIYTADWQDADNDPLRYRFAYLLGDDEYAYITPILGSVGIDLVVPLPTSGDNDPFVVALAIDSFGAVGRVSEAAVFRGLQLVVPEFVSLDPAPLESIGSELTSKLKTDSALLELAPLASKLLVPAEKYTFEQGLVYRKAILEPLNRVFSIPEYIDFDDVQMGLQIIQRNVLHGRIDAETSVKVLECTNKILASWISNLEMFTEGGDSKGEVSLVVDRSTLRTIVTILDTVATMEFVNVQGKLSAEGTTLTRSEANSQVDLFARCKVVTSYAKSLELLTVVSLYGKVPMQKESSLSATSINFWAQRGGALEFVEGREATVGLLSSESARLLYSPGNETVTDLNDILFADDPMLLLSVSKFNPFELYRECNGGVDEPERRLQDSEPSEQQLLANVLQIRTLDGVAPFRAANIPAYKLVTDFTLTTPVSRSDLRDSDSRIYCGYYDVASLEYSSVGCSIGVNVADDSTPITIVECTCSRTSGDFAVWAEEYREPELLNPHASEFVGLIVGPIFGLMAVLAMLATWKDRKDREKLRMGVHNLLVEERRAILRQTLNAWKASRKSRGKTGTLSKRKEQRDREKEAANRKSRTNQGNTKEVMFWQSQIVVSAWDFWLLSLFRQHVVFGTIFTYHPFLTRTERVALLCSVPLGAFMLASILYDGSDYNNYEIRFPVLVFASLAVVPVQLLSALIPSLRSDTEMRYSTFAHMYRFLNARMVLAIGNILYESKYRERVAWKDSAFEINYDMLRAQDQLMHMRWRLKNAKLAKKAMNKAGVSTTIPEPAQAEGSDVVVSQAPRARNADIDVEIDRLVKREEKADRKLKRVTALHVVNHHGATDEEKLTDRSIYWAWVGVGFLLCYIVASTILIGLFAFLNTYRFAALSSWATTAALGTALSVFVVDPVAIFFSVLWETCRGSNSKSSRNQKLILAHARGSHQQLTGNRFTGGSSRRRKRYSSSATSMASGTSMNKGYFGFSSLFKSSRELDLNNSSRSRGTSTDSTPSQGLTAPAVRATVRRMKSSNSQHSGSGASSSTSWIPTQMFGRRRKDTDSNMEVTSSDWNLV